SSSRFHDLGTLLFAFTMLWAYLSFSQFLIIWAGNLKSEIPWYMHRVMGEWAGVATFLLVFHFFVPFFILLSRPLKRRKHMLAVVAGAMILISMVDIFWLIMPAFFPSAAMNAMDFLAALLAAAAIGGIWLWAFAREVRGRPLVPLHDPNMEVVAVEHGAEPAPGRQLLRLGGPEPGDRTHPDRTRHGPDSRARRPACTNRCARGLRPGRTSAGKIGAETRARKRRTVMGAPELPELKVPMDMNRNRRREARGALIAFALLLGLLLAPTGARGQEEPLPTMQNPTGSPDVIKQIGIDQKLDAQVPLDLTFRDERGASVSLRQFFGRRPVILTLVYYQCPMLCTF